MFTSNEQISPPSLVLNCKVAKFCIKECPKAVNLKRISTQKECKCKEFSLQTRLGGEICSSDVIMHKGHYLINFLVQSPGLIITCNQLSLRRKISDPVSQWYGQPRDFGIPIPKTLVIWASPSHISLTIWVRVRVTGDALITRVWRMGMSTSLWHRY